MKPHSPSFSIYSKIAVLVIPVALMVSAVNASQIRAQDPNQPKLMLVTRDDGFSGTYELDGKTYVIENRVWEDKFLTRIIRPDGSLLVESSRDAAIVAVILPTGTLRINATQAPGFSAEETRTIERFVQSEDCSVVKTIVAAVFKNRAGQKKPLLGGFSVISMLLGE